jgi:predicted nucleic acid-binding protein
MKLFIDSDVLLDFFFDRQPFSVHSRELLNLCEKGTVQGVVTPLVLSNVHYLLRQKNNNETAMKCIQYLVDQLEVISMNKNTVLAGLHSGFKDFEDSLQYGAVINDSTVSGIITRNVKDYKKSRVAVHTPVGFLAVLR